MTTGGQARLAQTFASKAVHARSACPSAGTGGAEGGGAGAHRGGRGAHRPIVVAHFECAAAHESKDGCAGPHVLAPEAD